MQDETDLRFHRSARKDAWTPFHALGILADCLQDTGERPDFDRLVDDNAEGPVLIVVENQDNRVPEYRVGHIWPSNQKLSDKGVGRGLTLLALSRCIERRRR
jgi:hypothetical protein